MAEKQTLTTLAYIDAFLKLAENHRVMTLTGIKSLLVIWAAIKSDSFLPQILGMRMEREGPMERRIYPTKFNPWAARINKYPHYVNRVSYSMGSAHTLRTGST